MNCPPRAALLLTLAACSVPPKGWPTEGTQDTGTAAPVQSGSVSGTVSDADGQPIPGAALTSSPLGYEAVSDADGAYVLSRLPVGDYQILGAAEGYDPAWSATVSVLADQAATADITLQPGPAATVQVQVTGPLDTPVEGATVQVGDTEALTNADGIAWVQVPPGTVDVTASLDGLWPYTIRDVELAAGGGIQLAATLAGRSTEDSSLFTSNTICAICHSEMVEQAALTPHGRTLTDGAATELDAWFTAGTTVELSRGAVATLSVSGEDQVVTITAENGDSVAYTVAGWIGDLERGSVPYTLIGWVDTNAYPLPVAWIAGDPDSDYPDDIPRWVPYQDKRWVDMSGVVGDPEATDSAEMHCFACHSVGFDLIPRDDDDTIRMVWGPGRWREGSVGCEACHGPGSSHQGADTTEERRSYITQPQLLDQERADAVCAQCHSAIEGSQGLPFPWDETEGYFHPGQSLGDFSSTAVHWASGAAAGPNEQSDELFMSAHAGLLRCIDCHDPHGDPGYRGQLRLDAQDNSLCLSCHEEMTFEGDEDLIKEHTGHVLYDPDGTTRSGQCIACHMPGTAGRLSFSDESGAGDLSSHLFNPWSPQDTVDVFDAEGETTLPVGSFPTYGCADCHARYNWPLSTPVVTSGDPTLRETHVDFQAAWDERF